MSVLKRLGVVGCVALSVAVLQFSFLSEACAQRGGNAPGGILAPSGVDAAGGDEEFTKAKFVEFLDDAELGLFRGYKTEEIPSSWKMQGKFLVCDGSEGDIMTKDEFEDFELQAEWKVEAGGNSGIMFHVTTDADQPYMTGPEIQILDDDKHPDGKSELTSAGALYGLYPAAGKTLRPVGSWNKVRLIVTGDKVVEYLNNAKVLDVEMSGDDWNKRLAESKFKDWAGFAKSKSGHICFQNHGDPVSFRNIRIKKLGVMEEPVTDAKQKTPRAVGATGGGGGTPRGSRPPQGGDEVGGAPGSPPQRGGGRTFGRPGEGGPPESGGTEGQTGRPKKGGGGQ